MKTRIAALVTAGVLALSMLTGCGSKQESWKVTCPWAPSGVAAMVSQKAAAKSPDYSEKKITLVAEAVKGDAATVNTWVASTKANDKELVFAGEGLFAITETLDPAKLQFSYDDFEFVENLYSSVFVLSADSSLNLKSLDDLEAYVKAGNPVSVAVNGATGSEAFLAAALFGSMGAGDQLKLTPYQSAAEAAQAVAKGETLQSRISPRSSRPTSRAALTWSAHSTTRPSKTAPSQGSRASVPRAIPTSATAASLWLARAPTRQRWPS